MRSGFGEMPLQTLEILIQHSQNRALIYIVGYYSNLRAIQIYIIVF